ncbi:unnamed protein product, partial [Didymodactylos carnosus]
ANMDISVDKVSILRSPLVKDVAEEFDQRFTQALHMIASQSRTKFTETFLSLHDELTKIINNVDERERMMNYVPTTKFQFERLFYLMGLAYGIYFPAELKL